MSFKNILEKPLPSQVDPIDRLWMESYEDDDDDETVNTVQDDDDNDDEVNGDDIEDTDDDDDFNPDEMSDEELAALDAELSGDEVNDAANTEDDDEVQLSPEEEIKADDMMSVAATTMLVNDELNDDEKKDFVKTEGAIAVNEGFMTDSDLYQLVQENTYNKKMIIRLDAASKKKQLYAIAVNVSAAAHNDPDYRKLKKVMRVRKILRAKLEQKYHSEATKRMKIYFARLRKSKSSTLRKVGSK